MHKTLMFLALAIASLPSFAMDVHDQLFTSMNTGDYAAISLGISGSSGNRESTTYDSELTIAHHDASATWLATAEYRDSKTNNVKTDELEQIHLRLIKKMSEKGAVEALAQHKRDVLAGVSRVVHMGVGYRYDTNIDKARLALGAGVLYEQIRFAGYDSKEQVSRGHFYLATHMPLGSEGRATLSASAAVTPKLSDLVDWRAEAAVTLSTPVTKHLSLNLQALYDYDAEPERNIKEYNLTYQTRLTYSF